MSDKKEQEKKQDARRWRIILVIVLALIVLCLIFCPKFCCTGKQESKAPAPMVAVDTVKPAPAPEPVAQPEEVQAPEFTVASLTPVAADVQQIGYQEEVAAFNQLVEKALAKAQEENATNSCSRYTLCPRQGRPLTDGPRCGGCLCQSLYVY